MKKGWQKNILSWLIFGILLSGSMIAPLQGSQDVPKKRRLNITQLYKQLAPRYKQWYDLVTYIISDTEEKIFFQLENDRERDAFIQLFWKMRDPSPETEENEFRLEHIKRFNYANKRFKYGTARPGWQTDMGKIYIILGEPQSIDRYEEERVVEPLQIWSYYGVFRLGIPNAFNLVFWKRGGVGEYKIYNPQADGPYALLKKTHEAQNLDPFDYERVFEFLAEYNQIVAMNALSLIPNEIPYNYTPSLQSSILLKNIQEFPTQKINTRYATDFMNYKGIVRVDHASTYMECSHEVHVAKNPQTGLNFLHFSLLPKSVSVSYLKDTNQFSFNFRVTVNLRKGKQTIFTYTKNFPFTGTSEEDVKRQFAKGVIISDSFPVVPGHYKLEVLIQNPVKSEFSFFDQMVTIPGDAQKLPDMVGPILTYEVRRNPSLTLAPYKFMEHEVTVNPRKDFGKKDTLFCFIGISRGNYSQPLKMKLVIEDIFEKEKYSKTYEHVLEAGRKFSYITQQLEPLEPGNYNVTARLLSGSGTLLAMKDFRFQISLINNVARPTVAKKVSSLANQFVLYHILGLQFQRLRQLDKAEQYMTRALTLKPGQPQIIKDYCSLLINKRDFDKILPVVEQLKGNSRYEFDYYAIRGKALYLQNKYQEAVTELLKANEKYDSDIGVLNFLGHAYLRMKKKDAAVKAFEASLKVNRDQKNIKDLLQQLIQSK